MDNRAVMEMSLPAETSEFNKALLNAKKEKNYDSPTKESDYGDENSPDRFRD
jgi:hypothetical protein